MRPLSYINEIPLYPAWNPGAEDRRRVVNTACQPDRIQNHLEDKPLGVSLRICLTGFIAVTHPTLISGGIASRLEILGRRETRMPAEH